MSDPDDKEMRNKFAKFYFTQCMNGNLVDWSLVDGSDDFKIIPTNSKGVIQMQIGDLRGIINEVCDYHVRARRDLLKEIAHRIPGKRYNDVLTLRTLTPWQRSKARAEVKAHNNTVDQFTTLLLEYLK